MSSNNINYSNYIKIYVSIILCVKIAYIILNIAYLRSKHKKYKFTKNLKNITNLIHNIFYFLLIFFIIILFNPFIDFYQYIDYQIRLIIFSFGILTLVTQIQNIVSN